MAQGQGGQQNNSSAGIEFAYYAGFLVVSSVIIWYFFSGYIVRSLYDLSMIQAYIMLVPLDFLSGELASLMPGFEFPEWINGDDLAASLSQMSQTISVGLEHQVSISECLDNLSIVGFYLMIYTLPLWLFAAIHLYFSSTESRFRNKYSMENFRQLESFNWPSISTVLGKNYSKIDIDEGAFAMSLQPVEFAERHGLLKEETIEGKTVAVVDKQKAYQVFSQQMGPTWNGTLHNLPKHILALIAIFSAKAEHDTKSSDQLLRQIAKSSRGEKKQLDFSGVSLVLMKHIKSMKIAKVVGPHAFLYPAMASLLTLAREDGVLATAEFLWLKTIDRPLWYMLNSVGRKTAFPEVSGPFAHWILETKLRRPLKTPMVQEAITALESGVSEFIYKPKDGNH